MSNDIISELESKLNSLNRIVVMGWTLLVAAFCLGVWVTNLQIQTNTNSKEVQGISLTMKDIEIWKASTEGNRYTSKDANTSFAIVNDSLNGQDKRLQRVEDGYVNVIKSLDRIEARLGTK